MEYFEKNLNMSFSGNFNFIFKKYSIYYAIYPGSIPSSITLSIPNSDFNIQKFVKLGVKVQMTAKMQGGGVATAYVEYRQTDFDNSSAGGVTAITLTKHSTGNSIASRNQFVSYATKVTFFANFLRCGLPNGYYYNFDNTENTIVFTTDIPLTWSGGAEEFRRRAFLDQKSDIRIWSVPEYNLPVYTSEIFANQKMVTLPIIANGQNILRLKAKPGYNGTLTDVISKYNQNDALNRFVPVILTNGGLKSIVSSEYNEYEEGEISVTTEVPSKITLGPLNENGNDNPYYYDWGELYYKTVVFDPYFNRYETVSVKYNFTSFDSSTRKIVFSLDTSSYTPTTEGILLHDPGDVLTILTGLSFKLRSFYEQTVTSPMSNMTILMEGKLYTSMDVTSPTFKTLNYTAPASFQALMAWEGRSGARSKVY